MANDFDCPEHLLAATHLAIYILQPIREWFKTPVITSSWYRSPALNKAVGGAENSQHCKGQAVDIDSVKGVYLSYVFEFIRDHLSFDQLIWEFGNDIEPDWIHVSFKLEGGRGEVLRSKKVKGKTVYERI